MPTKIDRLHKVYKGRNVAKSAEELIKSGICPECFNDLPDAKVEQRQGGYSEFVTECSCGATFTD